ncbi:hypothetical protein [Glycomyces halotolerans]
MALVLTMTAIGCVGGGPDDVVPTKSDGAFDLEVVDNEACEAAGHQELVKFFADNDIEVTNEEVDGEYPYCKIEMVWAVSDGGDEKEATLYFDLVVYDSVAKAQQSIDQPEKLLMTAIEFRNNYDGRVESVPDPWEDGFIWSASDSVSIADTEVAVRIANIVVYADFYYPIPRANSCEEEGCVVLPSTLVSWIRDSYLPAREQAVDDLIER